MWNMDTGVEEKRFEWHTSLVESVAFSPDGCHLASGSSNMVHIWNVEIPHMVEMLMAPNCGRSVSSVAFSPDGCLLATGWHDNIVRIWNVKNREEMKTCEGHSCPVNSVAFSPDGCQVVSGSCDNTVRIWDVEKGIEERTFEGHSHSVNSVAISPDGCWLASGSYYKTVRI